MIKQSICEQCTFEKLENPSEAAWCALDKDYEVEREVCNSHLELYEKNGWLQGWRPKEGETDED